LVDAHCNGAREAKPSRKLTLFAKPQGQIDGSFDLYRVEAQSIEAARTTVEKALGLTFEARDSSYHGGTYYAAGSRETEHFILKLNLDLDDNEPAEVDFPKSPALLYVNDTNRSEAIREALAVHADMFVPLRL
jgi:hypothetical protein